MKLFLIKILLLILPITLSSQINYLELTSQQIIYGKLAQKSKKVHKIPKDTTGIDDHFGLKDFLHDISNQLSAERPNVLFFIHGMWDSKRLFFKKNYDYLQSAFVDNDNSTVGSVVLITWNASDLLYPSIQEKALEAAPAFQCLLENLVNYKAQNEVAFNLQCHSLGNFVLYHALNDDYENVFNKLIMAAPDVPILKNDNQWRYQRLEKISQHILLLQNKKDKALLLSEIVNQRKRLGKLGLNADYKGKIEVHEIHQYTDVKDLEGKITNHIHHRTSPTVIGLIVDFLNRP